METVEGVFDCQKTQSYAVGCKLTKEVIQWFKAGGAPDYTDVAIGAEDAADARKRYAEPLIAKGILKAEVPGDAIMVKKFWIACNDQYQRDRKPSTGTAEEEDLAPAAVPQKGQGLPRASPPPPACVSKETCYMAKGTCYIDKRDLLRSKRDLLH